MLGLRFRDHGSIKFGLDIFVLFFGVAVFTVEYTYSFVTVELIDSVVLNSIVSVPSVVSVNRIKCMSQLSVYYDTEKNVCSLM